MHRCSSDSQDLLAVMLAAASASSASLIIYIDLTSTNWTQFKKQTLRLLQTSYGSIWNSVITGTAPPTNTIHTRNDIDSTRCIYKTCTHLVWNVGTQPSFSLTQESLHVKDSRSQLHDVELNHRITETLHDYGQRTIQRLMIESCWITHDAHLHSLDIN